MSAEIPVNHRQTCVVLTVLALASTATKSQSATKEEYYNLTDSLFYGYRKDVRPVFVDTKCTFVSIGFYLYSIVNINEREQTMRTNAMLEIMWQDEYLSWQNKNKYANISSILVRQSSVWLPDIVVGNTVTSQTQLGYNELQVLINSKGTIKWLPTAVFQTSCEFDVTYYPFDTQVCTVEFTTAMSTARELIIHSRRTNSIKLSSFSQDGIWKVVNTSANNGEDENGRAQISFSLQLKRRPAFYVLNIILPVVLIAMTSSLVFALPAETGEKMSLSITVLLGFAVYLKLVTVAMPKTSLKVSVLMVYVIQLMALTTLSVILSVPLLKLHHRSPDRPLGTKATKVIVLLRKVMCMSADQRSCKVAEAMTSSQNDGRLSTVNEHKQQRHTHAIALCDNSHNNDCRSPSASSTKRSCEVNPVSGEVASETISMFLFYIFLLYSVVVTVFYIIILITGRATQEESTRLTFDNSLTGANHQHACTEQRSL